VTPAVPSLESLGVRRLDRSERVVGRRRDKGTTGLAAFLIAVLVERALALEPWSSRWLAVALVLGALALNVALAPVAIAASRRSAG